MFSIEKIYDYNGLFLDKETRESLGIEEASGIEILSLIQQYDKIYQFQETSYIPKSKQEMMKEFSNQEALTRNYCYLKGQDKLAIIPITIYYGIFEHDRLVARYDTKSVQESMFNKLIVSGLPSIMEDISNQSEFTNEYNKQQQFKKTYQNFRKFSN